MRDEVRDELDGVSDAAARELDELLGRLCDGGLDEAEAARLRLLLREPAAQERYAEYLLLHEALRTRLSPGGRLGHGELPGLDLARARGAGRARPARTAAVAAAALALAAGVALVIFPARAPRDSARGDRGGAAAETPGIAVVTATADARWAEPGRAVVPGVPLPAGRLTLLAGLAQIDLYSGATLVLEGPASLELQDARSARVEHGRVRVRVAPQARGLRLALPGGQLVDLGTEFALAVPAAGEGPAELHVVDGAVEWHGQGAVTRVEGGRGLRLEAGGARAIPADARGFADPARLVEAAAAARRREEEHRRSLRERLARDPAVLLYLDFDPRAAGPWGRLAANLATGSARAGDGAIVGCGWALGRWPDKPALEFKRPSDRVLVDVPGRHASFTLAAWVRFDGLDHSYNAFLHTDGWEEGDVHAHIQPSGEIVLDLFGRERLSSRRRIGRADFGRWIHLAWTWDAGARRVSLYIDGRLDAALPIAGDAPVRFGSAQIGNWDREHRNLNGQLDELLLLGRALTAAEVAELAGS